MLNKIKTHCSQMNWLSASILKFGLPLSCILLAIGVVFQYLNTNTLPYDYAASLLPMNMGRISILLFCEALGGALLIDYYVKKHCNQDS